MIIIMIIIIKIIIRIIIIMIIIMIIIIIIKKPRKYGRILRDDNSNGKVDFL